MAQHMEIPPCWRGPRTLIARAVEIVQHLIGRDLVGIVEVAGLEPVKCRQLKDRVAFVTAYGASLVDGVATITGLQVQLRATITAITRARRIEVVAEQAQESGCR